MPRPQTLLSDSAYQKIRHDIICCAMPPGAEVSESRIGHRLRLSKAPVRAALTRLAHEGFLKAMPRRGYLVTPITLKDVQDVFELRLLLEPYAARLAAGRVDADRLRKLDEVCRAGYTPGDNRATQRFLDANKAFHVAIAQATGNARIAHSTAQLLDEMTRLLHIGLGTRNRTREMQHEHRSLLRALVKGDGKTAENICREQTETARDMVIRALTQREEFLNIAISGDTRE
jgi:DNA-binding GntR family transcriptional regulator